MILQSNLLHIQAKDLYTYRHVLLDMLFSKKEQKHWSLLAMKKVWNHILNQYRSTLYSVSMINSAHFAYFYYKECNSNKCFTNSIKNAKRALILFRDVFSYSSQWHQSRHTIIYYTLYINTISNFWCFSSYSVMKYGIGLIPFSLKEH